MSAFVPKLAMSCGIVEETQQQMIPTVSLTSTPASTISSGNCKPNLRRAKQSKVKHRTWKKPKGKPKRPLSAYNLFFQHERANILAQVRGNAPHNSRKAAPSGIGFANLARNIAQKWKNLDPEYRSVFEAKAAIEKKRYKKEVDTWTLNMKNKLLVQLEAASKTGTTTTAHGSGEQQQEMLVQSSQGHNSKSPMPMHRDALVVVPLDPSIDSPSFSREGQVPDYIGSTGFFDYIATSPKTHSTPDSTGTNTNVSIVLEPLDISEASRDDCDVASFLSSLDWS